jgi:hypothetical protein
MQSKNRPFFIQRFWYIKYPQKYNAVILLTAAEKPHRLVSTKKRALNQALLGNTMHL